MWESDYTRSMDGWWPGEWVCRIDGWMDGGLDGWLFGGKKPTLVSPVEQFTKIERLKSGFRKSPGNIQPCSRVQRPGRTQLRLSAKRRKNHFSPCNIKYNPMPAVCKYIAETIIYFLHYVSVMYFVIAHARVSKFHYLLMDLSPCTHTVWFSD